MQIRKITVDNFKSLLDFELDLAKFNCLIGLNGSGKSTLLQFIDFLAQQVRGDIGGWLGERNWQASEISSKLTAKPNIDFHVEVISSEGTGGISWKGSFDTNQLCCTTETIKTPGAALEVRDGRLRITEIEQGETDREVLNEEISFSYEGSVLSQLRDDSLPQSLFAFKNIFGGIKSLDLLSPEYLRKRTRESARSLGLGGQSLSAFLYELGHKKRHDLAERLRTVYPQLTRLDSKSLRSGWKQLEIVEQYPEFGQQVLFGPAQMTTEARHVNDGLLRLIAILAVLQSEHRFLLFDEIENGINSELVEFLLEALTSTEKQVLVTTHSPMILNYLGDEIAKAGVIYLYKTPKGGTQAIPFFSIPSLAEKLTVMGPGEAFVDTDLTALGEEIQAVTGAQ